MECTVNRGGRVECTVNRGGGGGWNVLLTRGVGVCAACDVELESACLSG